MRMISERKYHRRIKIIEPLIDKFIMEADDNHTLREGIKQDASLEKAAVFLLLDRLDLLSGKEAEKIIHFIETTQCIQYYRNQLTHSNKWKRAYGAMIIGRAKNVQFINDLVPLLNDRDNNVIISASAALARIGEPSSLAYLLDVIESITRSRAHIIVDNIIELCSKNVAHCLPLIIKLLESPQEHLRYWACIIIGELYAFDAVKKLQLLVKDDAPLVRSAAVKALGAIGDTASYEYISLALYDPDWHVRFNAVKALGELKYPRAIPALSRAMLDRQWEVNSQAVYALMAVDTSHESFIKLLDSDFQFVRWRAAEILGITGYIDDLINKLAENLPAEEYNNNIKILRACAQNGVVIPFKRYKADSRERIRDNVQKILKGIPARA